jgi:hypothetical protein
MGIKFRMGNTKAAKLTASEVLAMREDYRSGYTQGELCRKYRIGIAQVGRIVRNEVWTDVQVIPTDFDFEESARRLQEVQRATDAKAAGARQIDELRRDRKSGAEGNRMLKELQDKEMNETAARLLKVQESVTAKMATSVKEIKKEETKGDRYLEELKEPKK